MPEYDINDLAVQMGVPRRTIRYYVEIGLLPPPEGAGRAAMYGDEHLERLQAIKRLQSEGLTLDQIRDAIAPSSETTAMAANTRAPWSAPRSERPAAKRASDPGSASEYLAQVRMRMAPPRMATEKPQSPDAWQGEPWIRVRIDADTELHVRRSSTRRVTRLVKELRRILAEDPERTA